MLNTRSPLVLLALAVSAGVITSCSNDRRGGGPIIPPPQNKDATVNDMDSGNPPGDSGMQQQQDSGVNTGMDAAVGQDSGMMMTAECANNNECSNPNPFCLRISGTSLVQCTGENDCQCFQGCDPLVNVEASGCPRPAEACGLAGAMSPTPGVCIPDTGGGTQGQACTAQFNGQHPFDNYVGDNCNGAQNYLCHGADPLQPTGTCARICSTANQALCTSLDANTQCIPFAPGETTGVCARPITDVGVDCTMAGMCQGAECSAALGGQCSQRCGGSGVCGQSGTLCVFGQGISPICALECTFGPAGDTACANVNANLICEDIGIALCIPRCAADMDCPAARPTCNVGTGHCQ